MLPEVLKKKTEWKRGQPGKSTHDTNLTKETVNEPA